MHRRAFLASSTAVLFAGCSEVTGLLEDGYVDSRIEDEHTAEFGADAGEELTVTVDEVEVAEPDDDAEIQPDAISFRLDHADEGPLTTRSISKPETFDVTIEAAGTHIVIVTNGAADVAIGPSE